MDKVKEKLDGASTEVPFIRERELWWVSFGENVGFEINGKSSMFSRPGIVLKRLSSNFYLVAPTTTQFRTGSWYVTIIHKYQKMSVCLHQIRTMDYRRFSNKISTISENEFKSIKDGFHNLYK